MNYFNDFRKFILDFWSEFLRYREILVLNLIALLASIGILVLWIIKIRVSHFPFFNPLAKTYAGTADYSYLLPIFSIVILLVNTILARAAYKRDRLTAFFLLGATLLVDFFILSSLLNERGRKLQFSACF